MRSLGIKRSNTIIETLVSSKDQYCMKMGKVKGDIISINGITKSLEDAKDVYFNKFRQVIEQDL